MESLIEKLLEVNSQYNFIPQNSFILVVSLLVLGVYLKTNNNVIDELIPIFLLAFSCVASLLLSGANIVAFLQGIVCWGVSIAIHQTYKQTKTHIDNK